MNVVARSHARPQIGVRRITGTLGAEIFGVDLSTSLPTAMVQSLSDALVQHKVIFFRNQSISTEQHIAFAKQFGSLEVDPFTERSKSFADNETHNEVIVIESTAEAPQYQVRFRWEKDSIAFWDNRSTQHFAVPDFFPQHRRMERVTVAGDRPF